MKLQQKFEFVDMGDEIIAVPVGENAKEMQGVLKVNKEGKTILTLLEQQKDENSIINSICEEYETDRDTVSAYVNSFEKKLYDMGILK